MEKGWVSSELGSFLESIKQYSGELGLGSNIRSLMHVKGLDYWESLDSLNFTEEGNSKMQKCEKCWGKQVWSLRSWDGRQGLNLLCKFVDTNGKVSHAQGLEELVSLKRPK